MLHKIISNNDIGIIENIYGKTNIVFAAGDGVNDKLYNLINNSTTSLNYHYDIFIYCYAHNDCGYYIEDSIRILYSSTESITIVTFDPGNYTDRKYITYFAGGLGYGNQTLQLVVQRNTDVFLFIKWYIS